MTMPPASAPRPGIGSVVRAGTIAGVIAGILCAILWAIGSIFGTEFLVQTAGSEGLREVTIFMAFIVPVLVGLVVSLAAALLFRGVGALLWVLLIGFFLTLLSLAIPLFQPSDVTWPTRLWLCSMHLVTGLVIVPVVALAVGGRNLALLTGSPRHTVVVGEVVEDVVSSDGVVNGGVVEGVVVEDVIIDERDTRNPN